MSKRFYLILFFLGFVLLLEIGQALAGGVVQAWVKRYQNSLGNCYGRDIAVSKLSGNVAVTGYNWNALGGNYDYLTIMYARNGNILWSRGYNGTGNGYDSAFAVAMDASDNVYVTGCSWNGSKFDYATIKYDYLGNQSWINFLNSPWDSNDCARDIAVDASGNVYVTGYTWVWNSYLGYSYDFGTVKYDPLGNWVWGKNDFNVMKDIATALAVDNSGNAYVTGYHWNGANYDYLTIKYSSSGTRLWYAIYNGTGDGDDRAYDIAFDGSGNAYVTGASTGVGTGYDYLTIKYDASGNLQWNNRYSLTPGNWDDVAKAIAVSSSNNVYVTGTAATASFTDYGTIKYSSSGSVLWTNLYNGPAGKNDEASDVAVDDYDNAYVTGASAQNFQIPTSNYDYATIKYRPNGDAAWVKRYNGPSNGADLAKAIAVYDSCNVYVTGYSHRRFLTYDYYDATTIKYACPVYFPKPPLSVMSWGPVHLTVTDPVGDSIAPWYNTIGNGSSYYSGAGYDSIYIPNPIIGEYQIMVTNSVMFRVPATYSVGIRMDGNDMTLLKNNENTPPAGQSETANYNTLPHVRGDANGDEITDIGDIVYLINYVFYGGPAPDPVELGDANCDGVVDIGDIVHLINYVFYEGIPPCS
jgi:hypothetical protein